MFPFFAHLREHGCGDHFGHFMAGGCGPRGGGHGGGHWGHSDGDGGGFFGVRRPLRFLAYKLGLNDAQVADIARILNDLKTERAQAEVDSRRTLSALADAVEGETFDAAKAAEAAQRRVESAQRLKEAVVRALGEIHKVLNAEQRGRLAYLVRTGVLTM